MNVVVVRTVTYQPPLASVVPRMPAMKTASPVVSPCTVEVVMRIRPALVAVAITAVPAMVEGGIVRLATFV